jgi:leucyl aminopeptidase
MRKFTQSIILLFLSVHLFAQSGEWIYATMENESALSLQSNHPEGIHILSTQGNLSAVHVKMEVAHQLKGNNHHGPGFIYRTSPEIAISALNQNLPSKFNVLDFTITEDDYVNQVLGLVSQENLGNTILELENYGTRYHTTTTGRQAALDIKDKWQEIATAANRSDVTVELFQHQTTQQRSVILTIPGTEIPDEIVVIGGHLDSGDWMHVNVAPGADDNASGIATLTETLRILLDQDFYPRRTVQIMAYAAEEIGLVGSEEIAVQYEIQNKNVVAMAQFDMTNYNGSSYDVGLISDPEYTSSELNLFWVELMEHYNSTGPHQITYGTTACGYGCSDHVSWTERGYLASFPFESSFEDRNPFVHSNNDTFASMNNDASHSVKFVKLALEFVIEIAKQGTMSTEEVKQSDLHVVVKNKELIYQFKNSDSPLHSVQIYDTTARSLIQKSNLNSNGTISLRNIPTGYYIAVFKDAKGKSYSKKFLLK